MPKYWGKQIFSLGSFPEVGQKQKTEKKERLKVGNNNGRLCIANPTSGGARTDTWAKSEPLMSSPWLNAWFELIEMFLLKNYR